jgi:hypothetical protein
MDSHSKNYISRCPYEVLQQILSYTITDRPTTRRVDLSLRQVSRLFRDVADSLLWRTLNVNNVILKLLRQTHAAGTRVEYEASEFDKCVRNLRFVGTEMQWSRDLMFTRDERGATRPFLSYEEARDIYQCAGEDIVQRFDEVRSMKIADVYLQRKRDDGTTYTVSPLAWDLVRSVTSNLLQLTKLEIGWDRAASCPDLVRVVASVQALPKLRNLILVPLQDYLAFLTDASIDLAPLKVRKSFCVE